MISSQELNILLKVYSHIFEEYRPFFSHPFSLLVNYPEADIEVVGIEKREVVAYDSFGRYMPFFYGNVDLALEVGDVSALALAQLVDFPDGQFSLVDWEFVYDETIFTEFKHRRYLINRFRKIGCCELLRGKEILECERVLSGIVEDWYEKRHFSGEADITARAMRQCLEFAFDNLRQDLLPEESVSSILAIQDKQVIGFSFMLLDEDWMYEVFEFTCPQMRWIATALFYHTVKVAFDLGVRWINTLGCNRIEGLNYNKQLYNPRFLLPRYSWRRKTC